MSRLIGHTIGIIIVKDFDLTKAKEGSAKDPRSSGQVYTLSETST